MADAETQGTRDELFPGWLARAETALIHGEPRVRKTWVALEFAVALTTGTSAFGLLMPPAKARVAYVTNEDGAGPVSARLRGLLAGRGIDTAPEGFRLMVRQGVALDDPEWQARLISEVRRFEIDMVTLDPLRSVTVAVDQGPREFQPFGNYLRRLIGETGCGVLCVHHDTKPTPGVPETRRRAQRSSGGGLFGHMDSPIHAAPAGDDKTLLVADGFKHTDDPVQFCSSCAPTTTACSGSWPRPRADVTRRRSSSTPPSSAISGSPGVARAGPSRRRLTETAPPSTAHSTSWRHREIIARCYRRTRWV